jgi:hypothetical protein
VVVLLVVACSPSDDEAILVGWSLAAFIVRDRFLAALLGESWGRFEEFWDLG